MRKLLPISHFWVPVIILSALIALLAGCARVEVPQTEKNKALVARAWDVIVNQGNFAAADQIFAADYVYHSPGNPDLTGVAEAVTQPLSTLRTAFPDIHFTMEDTIAEGDLVVGRFTWTGTHQGELMGIQPTNNKVTVTGILVARIAEDKIAEKWGYEDALGLMQQLGAAPARGKGDYTWGPPPSEVTGAPGTPEENKAMYNRGVEMWNEKNLDLIDEMLSADFVNHDPTWPEVTGFESYKKWIADWFESAPDMMITVDALVAEGNKVAGRWTALWTDSTGLAGNPPTNQEIVVTGIDIYRIADGKVVEEWWAKDFLGVMKQAGMMPAPEEAGKETP